MLRRVFSTTSFKAAFTDAKSQLTGLKDDAIEISLDNYVKLTNQITTKIDKNINKTKKVIVTTSLNLGMMNITTVIEEKDRME